MVIIHFMRVSWRTMADAAMTRSQADLAGRDFTAERGEAVVISTGAVVSDIDRERGARERAVAQVWYCRGSTGSAGTVVCWHIG